MHLIIGTVTTDKQGRQGSQYEKKKKKENSPPTARLGLRRWLGAFWSGQTGIVPLRIEPCKRCDHIKLTKTDAELTFADADVQYATLKERALLTVISKSWYVLYYNYIYTYVYVTVIS